MKSSGRLMYVQFRSCVYREVKNTVIISFHCSSPSQNLENFDYFCSNFELTVDKLAAFLHLAISWHNLHKTTYECKKNETITSYFGLRQ